MVVREREKIFLFFHPIDQGRYFPRRLQPTFLSSTAETLLISNLSLE